MARILQLPVIRGCNGRPHKGNVAMSDAPAGTGCLSEERVPLRSSGTPRAASELLCNGSLQNKAVRFGSLEPAHVTLAKQSILPLVVVFMLAVCVFACGRLLSVEFYALGLVAFLISAQVFSPVDLANAWGAPRLRKVVLRILLEWSCVAAVLVFLSVSFKLTQVFSRDIIVSWFLLTPIALLLVDSLRGPFARWLASDLQM